MKKITLLVFALAITTFTFAQTVLSHSNDNTFSTNGSVACATDPDGTPGTGDESSSDNIYYRSYKPSNFGFTGSFEVQGGNIFLSFRDLGGSGATAAITFRVYSTTGVFPNGVLTEIASQTFDVSAANDGDMIEIVLDNSVVVDADSEIVIALDIPEATAAPVNYDVRIAINDQGEDAPSYLTSNGCSITDPTTTTAIGFPDNAILLDLVGDVALSVGDNLAALSSVYPNPMGDVLNVKVPSNVQVTSATLVDALGRNTGAVLTNGVMNTANLSNGIYILTVNTAENGSLTQKVVKQ